MTTVDWRTVLLRSLGVVRSFRLDLGRRRTVGLDAHAEAGNENRPRRIVAAGRGWIRRVRGHVGAVVRPILPQRLHELVAKDLGIVEIRSESSQRGSLRARTR